jgi:hypothetical protein
MSQGCSWASSMMSKPSSSKQHEVTGPAAALPAAGVALPPALLLGMWPMLLECAPAGVARGVLLPAALLLPSSTLQWCCNCGCTGSSAFTTSCCMDDHTWGHKQQQQQQHRIRTSLGSYHVNACARPASLTPSHQEAR